MSSNHSFMQVGNDLCAKHHFFFFHLINI